MTRTLGDDLMQTWLRVPLVLNLAAGDIRARYRRSILGPWWLTLGAGIGVAGLGLVWSALLNQDPAELIPRLAVGLILWQFLAGCVVESPGVFVRQAQIIRNFDLPYLIHPVQLIIRQMITLGHNLFVVVIVLFVFPQAFSPTAVFGILGFVLVAANMLWIAVVLGTLGARFRDMEPLIQSLMPLLFFVTPVIYEARHLGINQAIIWANPLSYFMEVVRAPFLGEIPPFFVYAATIGLLLVGWIGALLLFNSRGRRLAFWI